MLDLLLVTMSLISVVCIFFLCYVGYTLSEELKHNDSVINKLQDEIKRLREGKQDLWKRYEKLLIYVKNNVQIEEEEPYDYSLDPERFP